MEKVVIVRKYGMNSSDNTIVYRFPDYEKYRQACYFRYIRVRLKLKNLNGHEKVCSIPCIVLCEKATDIPVHYTELEFYIFDANKDFFHEWETLKQRAVAVNHLLNYVLHETGLSSIAGIDIDIIREFKEFMKTIMPGAVDLKNDRHVWQSEEMYQDTTWYKYNEHIIRFLCRYYDFNVKRGKNMFRYSSDELITTKVVRDKETGLSFKIMENKELSIKRPKRRPTKARVLALGHLEILLRTARKHDPFLRLAIAMAAFGGLREGEVVNTYIGRVVFNCGLDDEDVTSIIIDLSDEAPFFENWGKRTIPGKIKKLREQQIYIDFISQFKSIYDEHLALMREKGYDTSPGAPLFVNKWGKPMTVDTYTYRVKKLFTIFFMNDLRERRDKDLVVVASDMAFLNKYESEYPGAHMFRHWFTMYLITVAGLDNLMVMKWRGDSNPDSVTDYVIVNSDVLQAFRESMKGHQRNVLGGLNLDE